MRDITYLTKVNEYAKVSSWISEIRLLVSSFKYGKKLRENSHFPEHLFHIGTSLFRV